jgi:hypothetical protein
MSHVSLQYYQLDCLAAVCEGIQNNTSIGMFVSPSSPFVAYGDNVTIACTQQNRPGSFLQHFIN